MGIIGDIKLVRLYCFKNYCNDIYYNKSDDNIEVKLQDFIKLKCVS